MNKMNLKGHSLYKIVPEKNYNFTTKDGNNYSLYRKNQIRCCNCGKVFIPSKYITNSDNIWYICSSCDYVLEGSW